MQTKNDTSKPEVSPKQKAGEGCSGATCSASSDPPLTVYENRGGEVWERHPDGRRELFAEDIIRKLTKLESQRNAAWKTIKEIRDSVIADETFGDTVELLFGKPLEEAEEEIARLNSLLNAESIRAANDL